MPVASPRSPVTERGPAFGLDAAPWRGGTGAARSTRSSPRDQSPGALGDAQRSQLALLRLAEALADQASSQVIHIRSGKSIFPRLTLCTSFGAEAAYREGGKHRHEKRRRACASRCPGSPITEASRPQRSIRLPIQPKRRLLTPSSIVWSVRERLFGEDLSADDQEHRVHRLERPRRETECGLVAATSRDGSRKGELQPGTLAFPLE